MSNFDFIFQITPEMVKKAYLSLKKLAYQESYNLFLKKRLALFEYQTINQPLSYDKDTYTEDYSFLDVFFEKFSQNLNNTEYLGSQEFTKLLNEIKVYTLPKKVVGSSKYNGDLKFYSNNKTAKSYEVQSKSYFIDAPIEFHLIDILWTVLVGTQIDNKLTKDCYGNRLDDSLNKFEEYSSNELLPITGQNIFKFYYSQYNAWRDSAISSASKLAINDDVAILSLDIKSFYYSLDINFEEVSKQFKNSKNLTNYLKEILGSYNELLRRESKNNEIRKSLPIGFTSSAVLANYSLIDLDTDINRKLRPNFYGRYVDDILIVIKRPHFDDSNPVESFIEKYLVENTNIKKDNETYNLDFSNSINKSTLSFQKDKIALQFFDKNSSKAGLELLRQELYSKTSMMSKFNNEHLHESNFDECAYEILYEDESETIRSIVGLNENKSEFENFLNSHISAKRLCRYDKASDIFPKIKLFFKGVNAIKFHKSWQKVYEYLFLSKAPYLAESFKKIIENEVRNLKGEDENDIETWFKDDKQSLYSYNCISYSLAKCLTIEISEYSKNNIENALRVSNLFNHRLAGWSLINYCKSKQSLVDSSNIFDNTYFEIDENKIEYSPRYINFDEIQLLKLLQFINKQSSNESPEFLNWFNDCIESEFGSFNELINKLNISDENPRALRTNIFNIPSKIRQKKIKLGVANMMVLEQDIESNLRQDKIPNLSRERHNRLINILKESTRQKCDLLLLPEVSVPVSWLPFMVEFSRKYQLGIVFGLEHWVSNDIAYNLIIESLPFKDNNDYAQNIFTVRLKNHYSPHEIKAFDEYYLNEPKAIFKNLTNDYHKIQWRGMTFTTYNCYELADISHRALFKSEIDLLIASVFNKDTNYYDHIMESVVRDLHCYVAQVNTSQYGGSCILRPSKTEMKRMMYLKGGENDCVLTTTIDIDNLRDFQFSNHGNLAKNNQKLKGTPPGYDKNEVLIRKNILKEENVTNNNEISTMKLQEQ